MLMIWLGNSRRVAAEEVNRDALEAPSLAGRLFFSAQTPFSPPDSLPFGVK
jgi:hypothetical protein